MYALYQFQLLCVFDFFSFVFLFIANSPPHKMSQTFIATPLIQAAAWFMPRQKTLQASIHKRSIWLDVILSENTEKCVISVDDLPNTVDVRDLQIHPSTIECTHVEGVHTTVVGRTILKLHFVHFALKLEFLVTTPIQGGERHPVSLGSEFIRRFVNCPLTERLITFIIPEDIFMHCRCDGLYCGCRPIKLVVQYYPQLINRNNEVEID
jgi:hypothetical protein